MTSTYGYIRTDADSLTAYCPPRPGATAVLRKTFRVIANIGDIMQRLLLPAALIILVAVIAAAPKPTAAMPHATITGTHIVACDRYLSHAAQVIAQQVGPAPTASFCSVAANGQ